MAVGRRIGGFLLVGVLNGGPGEHRVPSSGMRAHRGVLLGWVAVLGYAALLVAVTVAALRDPDLDRSAVTDADPVAGFAAAWERSREATFVASGTYERTSEVTGASLSSEDVLAQRPPQRVHRQLGGVEGRDEDRLLVCPAPPAGADERAPCRLGPPSGVSYAASVAREVDGVRSLTAGDDPLYSVREPHPGCFELRLRRIDPRAPFGVEASFCFDAATGAPTSSRVRYEGGIVEVVVVTSLRSAVTDADFAELAV